MRAESDVYCNVVMNLDKFNISNKTLFTLTFIGQLHRRQGIKQCMIGLLLSRGDSLHALVVTASGDRDI